MLPTSGFQINTIRCATPGFSIVSEPLSVYTPIFNCIGLAAFVAPCSYGTDGLPVGVQIAGNPLFEVTVCQVAYPYEKRTD